MSIPYNSITHHSEQSAPSDSNSGTQPNSLDQDPDFASEGSERNSQVLLTSCSAQHTLAYWFNVTVLPGRPSASMKAKKGTLLTTLGIQTLKRSAGL